MSEAENIIPFKDYGYSPMIRNEILRRTKEESKEETKKVWARVPSILKDDIERMIDIKESRWDNKSEFLREAILRLMMNELLIAGKILHPKQLEPDKKEEIEEMRDEMKVKKIKYYQALLDGENQTNVERIYKELYKQIQRDLDKIEDQI